MINYRSAEPRGTGAHCLIGSKSILNHYLSEGRDVRVDNRYFYGHYYAAQAMWQAGDNYWNQWYPIIVEELSDKQTGDGFWQDPSVCDEYGTAMAVIILQTPSSHLPIFQR